MILASFYLTAIIPIWNIFLLSLFIACLIAISLIAAISSSTCMHSRSYNPICLPQAHNNNNHHHHNNHHHRHADSNTHIHGREFEYGATYPHIHTR